MKKSLFGLGAKVAMAVLAVCSFALTSCYEKSTPNVDQDPIYYVVGTVYNAATSEALDAAVTVNGNAVTVTSGSFITKVSAAGAVTVAAEADGFYPVSRTVQVAPAAKNQISVSNADIAMLPIPEPEPEPEPLPDTDVVPGTLTAAELIDTFGFPEDIEIDDEGKIVICRHEQVDTHDAHDAHALTPQDGHGFHYTYGPYDVKAKMYSGYIWDFLAQNNDDIVKESLVVIYANAELNSTKVGSKFKDFNTEEKTFTVNEEGQGCLLCVYIHTTFTQWALTYVMDGVVYTANCVKADNTTVAPLYDAHDNHDSHDNHFPHHDGHDDHGHTNAGGGAGDAE